MLQIILTTISTGTGPNETWSIPAISNPYMFLFCLSQIFYESLYLHLKLSSFTVWLPINENGDVPLYINVGKNIGTGITMIVFIAINFVNTLLFREISTFTFYFDWFTWNYKDQTDSKLPESGFCTHIVLKTHVLQGDMLRGRNRTLGSLYWGKK